MAELIWSNKHTPPPSTNHRDASGPQCNQLVTIEQFPPEQETTTGTWINRLIYGDNLHTLPLLLEHFANTINLIYIDPPFMTGRTFGQGNDIAYRDTWNNNIDSYLQWLHETLTILHALLSPTGSLYMHLDWRVTHYIKIILDELFGFNTRGDGPGFKNEIIWHYQSGGGHSQRYFARKHDSILLYTKSAEYCFHPERVGEKRGNQRRNHMRKEIDDDGRVAWTIRSAGRIYTYPEDSLMTPGDVWNDIHHLHQKDPERTGYATQKPEALLERIILASSEEEDLVLDCFCGSGVTPIVAERLGRRWIACDQSELAIMTTRNRLLALPEGRAFVIQHIK